ncbi:MAG: hypothetical protein HDP34_04225, partial [Clostridia bacterium]|nr:hypothetical protein [Clostridia bacterium]
VTNGTLFIGKNIDGIKAILADGVDLTEIGSYSGELKSGATQSNFLCVNAAAFAAANYNAIVEMEAANEEGGDE